MIIARDHFLACSSDVRAHRTACRSGLTLLEVIISLAIFLLSIIAIGHLINLSAERAIHAQFRQQAGFLCQSKLAEFAAGAEPLSGQSEMPFLEDPDWVWSAECTAAEVPGLWRVQVRVNRHLPNGSRVEVALSKMILDPAQRGSTADLPPEGPPEEEPTPAADDSEPSTPATDGGT